MSKSLPDLPSECADCEIIEAEGSSRYGLMIFHSVYNGNCLAFFAIRFIRDDDDSFEFESRSLGGGDADKAQWLVRGTVDRSGCCDMDIGRGDSYRNHFCSLDEARDVGRSIERIYALAARKIPGWAQ